MNGKEAVPGGISHEQKLSQEELGMEVPKLFKGFKTRVRESMRWNVDPGDDYPDPSAFFANGKDGVSLRLEKQGPRSTIVAEHTSSDFKRKGYEPDIVRLDAIQLGQGGDIMYSVSYESGDPAKVDEQPNIDDRVALKKAEEVFNIISKED